MNMGNKDILFFLIRKKEVGELTTWLKFLKNCILTPLYSNNRLGLSVYIFIHEHKLFCRLPMTNQRILYIGSSDSFFQDRQLKKHNIYLFIMATI
jgi:hypothetical protein